MVKVQGIFPGKNRCSQDHEARMYTMNKSKGNSWFLLLRSTKFDDLSVKSASIPFRRTGSLYSKSNCLRIFSCIFKELSQRKALVEILGVLADFMEHRVQNKRNIAVKKTMTLSV